MQITIGKTTKGDRVWLQGLRDKGITGERFTVTYGPDALVIEFGPDCKRKVTQAKGGIVDIVGKRVTAWAQGRTSATVAVSVDRQRVAVILD